MYVSLAFQFVSLVSGVGVHQGAGAPGCWAAVLFLRTEQGKRYFGRLRKKFSKAKALSVLAHKLGRSVYFILLRQQQWSDDKMLLAA